MKRSLPIVEDSFQEIERLKLFLRSIDLSKPALLIQPPIITVQDVQYDVVKARGYFSYPPYGLLRLASLMSDEGVETMIIDLNNIVLKAVSERDDPFAAIDRNLSEYLGQSGLVCLTHMFEANTQGVDDVARRVRRLNNGVPIICGGVAASANPQQLLRNRNINCIVTGEAEASIPQLIAFVRRTSDTPPPNIVYRSEEKTVTTFASRAQQLVTEIRSQYDQIRLSDYAQVGTPSTFYKLRDTRENFATILTKTGCRASCAFCGVRGFNGRGVKVREVKDVIDEMLHVYRNHQVRHFELLDDDFLYDTAAVALFLKSIAEQFPDITWSANNGLIASALSEEIIVLMERSGCIGFKIGLESGDPSVLRKLHKPTDIAGYRRACHILDRHRKLFVSTNIILGTPMETVGNMIHSFSISLSSPTCWTNYYNYQNLPGTELFQDPEGRSVPTIKLGQEINHAQSTNAQNNTFNPYAKTQKEKVTTLSGYSIFHFPEDYVPTSDELREIWFTFNTISNYLRNPVLSKLNCKTAVTNTAKWLIALTEAFPDNPMILCLLYYILPYTNLPCDREDLAQKARRLIMSSEYWLQRDEQFKFSDFLIHKLPPLDSIVEKRIMTNVN